MRDLVAVSAAEARVQSIVRPILEDLGYRLVRIRLGGGAKRKLQIMAERRSGGMEIDDCANVSRAVSTALDVENPISESFTLEVSSPGIDRPLTTVGDFADWTGHVAKIETSVAVEGRRRFKGVIEAVEGQSIRIDSEDGPRDVDFASIHAARLVITDRLLRAAAKPETAADA